MGFLSKMIFILFIGVYPYLGEITRGRPLINKSLIGKPALFRQNLAASPILCNIGCKAQKQQFCVNALFRTDSQLRTSEAVHPPYLKKTPK